MTNSYPFVVAPQQPRKLPLGEIENTGVPLQSAVTTAAEHLSQHGYVILEQVLSPAMVLQLRQTLDELLKQERLTPYEPGDGSAQPGDDELAEYLSDSYSTSPDELQRIMRRIRYTRAQNQDTPWPVGPQKINKTFMHIPNLFDHDRSQYVRNLPAKNRVVRSAGRESSHSRYRSSPVRRRLCAGRYHGNQHRPRHRRWSVAPG